MIINSPIEKVVPALELVLIKTANHSFIKYTERGGQQIPASYWNKGFPETIEFQYPKRAEHNGQKCFEGRLVDILLMMYEITRRLGSSTEPIASSLDKQPFSELLKPHRAFLAPNGEFSSLQLTEI